jgi:hypothetical protein
MDERIIRGLEQDRTIDITTKGRRSGRERRIEIWFFNIEEKIYITGSPGTRGWHANVLANPAITFHLKHTVQADIPGHCIPVTGVEERKRVFLAIFGELGEERNLEHWIAGSPLVEVELERNKARILGG